MRRIILTLMLLSLISVEAKASVLKPSDADTSAFGYAVAQSGNGLLVGSYASKISGVYYAGKVQVYSNENGSETEGATLLISGSVGADYFGYSVSLSDEIALVGAFNSFTEGVNYAGAAYVYRDIFNSSTGETLTESVKLIASDAVSGSYFGVSVAQSGGIAVVGSSHLAVSGHTEAGAAYIYQNIDSNLITGTVIESIKLVASNPSEEAYFGSSVAISNNIALVGARSGNVSQASYAGVAYVYLNVHGNQHLGETITEDLRLVASDASSLAKFGTSLSMSGYSAIVGAPSASLDDLSKAGAVYVYGNINAPSAYEMTEDLKLVASDASAGANFGSSVSLCGNAALVGASNASVSGKEKAGQVYFYADVLDASLYGSSISETVKITASNASINDEFGICVSLSGDSFVLGSNSEKAYTGSISSITTLDAGNTEKAINGISFESHTDWVIGETTSANKVNLSLENSANIANAGKAVYIGKNAGSNNNMLSIEGKITALTLFIGAEGNFGNALQFADTANYDDLASIYLYLGNTLAFEWEWASEDELFSNLGDTELYVFDIASQNWVKAEMGNYANYLQIGNTSANGMKVSAIPEPSTYAIILAFATLLFVVCYRARN